MRNQLYLNGMHNFKRIHAKWVEKNVLNNDAPLQKQYKISYFIEKQHIYIYNDASLLGTKQTAVVIREFDCIQKIEPPIFIFEMKYIYIKLINDNNIIYNNTIFCNYVVYVGQRVL